MRAPIHIGPAGRARATARGHRRHALTLLEGLIASVILTMVVVAVSQAILAGQMQTADALHRTRAVELAEAMMDEILRLPYDDPDGSSNPGPDGGEYARNTYDNLDDYHGFSESAGNLRDVAGMAYETTYDDFARSVAVVAGSETVAGFGPAIAGVLITVTVTDSHTATWSVEHFYPEP